MTSASSPLLIDASNTGTATEFFGKTAVHHPAQRAYDGGEPPRRLQVQKERVVNEVLADNAHGKPRIFDVLDHLPVTVSARSSEMRSM